MKFFSRAFRKERKPRDPLSPEEFKMDLVRLYNQVHLQKGEIEELRGRLVKLEKNYKYLMEL